MTDANVHITGMEMTASVGTVSVAMRNYLSSHQLWAAGHFCELAKEIEDKHQKRSVFDIRHRSYVIGAVLAAAGFLEAAINELFQDVADEDLSYAAPLNAQERARMKAYWRDSRGYGSILGKYAMALALTDRQPLEVGAEPFQSVDLLVKLRNTLAHFRPETVSGADANKLESNLRNKFSENALMQGSGNPYFPDKCLGAGCARWAASSAKNFADQVFERLKVQPNYQIAKW